LIVFIITLILAFPVPPLGPTLGRSPIDRPDYKTVLPITGVATYYNDGIFLEVVENMIRWNRIARDECSECLGYVAMLWSSDIGRRVCVDIGDRVMGPYLIVDSAAKKDQNRLIDRGWVIDVQYSVWFDSWMFPNDEVRVTVQECLDSK